MGQKIITQNQTYSPDLEVFLSKYYPYYRYEKTEGNGIMTKTGVVLTEKDSVPFIVKCYFKTEQTPEEKKTTEMIIQRMIKVKNMIEGIKRDDKNRDNEQKKMNDIIGVVPNAIIEDSDKAVMIIRQYLPCNLKERVYNLPYLTHIEKVWISFQLLYNINELHSKGIYHGDLKMENILLTSNGSVYLSDIATYKPTYIQINDITSYAYYFGSNKDVNQSCFLAPERLIDKKEIELKSIEEIYNNTPAMDVFSAGAIIAELFIEKCFLDYLKVVNHKKGKLNIDEMLSKIHNANIEKLIKRMIEKDETKRITIRESLQFFSSEVCPITMSHFLIQYSKLVNVSYWKPDMLIGGIYKHWRQIWKLLYCEEKCPLLYQQLNFCIVNKLILEPSFEKILTLEKTLHDKDQNEIPLLKLGDLVLYINVNDNSQLLNEDALLNQGDVFTLNDNYDCGIIFVNYITSALMYTKYNSTKLVAMEIIRHFSIKFCDLYNIQFIVPYFVNMLKEKNNLTRLTSLHYLLDILYSVNYDNLILPTSEYMVFDKYIFEEILNLYKSQDTTLILEFTNVIDKIIELEQQFAKAAHNSRMKIVNEDNNNNNTISDSNKNLKTQLIYKKYQEQLSNFKSTLFPVIEDLISKNDQIDITQILIRKLPSLLHFYGPKRKNEFTKFIITNFNKKGWAIQRDTLHYIPQMTLTLGEETFENWLLPCFEGLSSSNINEHVIFELVSTAEILITKSFLTPFQGVKIFKVTLPFLLHPNYLIRNKTINFISSLISLLKPIEIFKYLYTDIKPFLEIPIINITPAIVRDFIKNPIPRVCFEIEIKSIFWEGGAKDWNVNYPILNDYILKEISNLNSLNDYSEDYNIIKENYQFILDEFIVHSKKSDIVNDVKYIYNKNFNKNKNEEENAIYQSFFGQLFWFADGLLNYTIPHIITNENLNFKSQNNNILSHGQFKLRYLFKVLNISLSLMRLNELMEPSMQTNTNMLEIKNYLINKNFSSWRPSGQIITTLYDQNKSAIEKLIAVEEDKFASFDCEGGVIIWQLNDNKDKTFTLNKKWRYEPKNKCTISYNKTICLADNSNFIFASENKLYKYSPNMSKALNSQLVPLYSSEEGNDITSVITTGKNYKESQRIIFCNNNGRLNIFDQRMGKVALSYNIPIENGMISCLTIDDDNSLFIGTLGGFIMYYDFRINSVTQSFRYNDNTPIIGLCKYKMHKERIREVDLYSINQNANNDHYLSIWTGQDHEIALWNVNTLNCDVLFKVNKIFNEDFNTLIVEIPTIYKEMYDIKGANGKDIFTLSSNLEKNMSSLFKYTHIFNTNAIKRILMSNITEEFYNNSTRRLNRILNLYETPLTVQTVVSPLCDEYGNVCYLLSAGNDMTIRYWDITKEGMNGEKKSYLVNAPCKLSSCVFTTNEYDNTIVLQSNETFNFSGMKKDMPGISGFQNYNGIALHSMVQGEFEEKAENSIQYARRIAEAAHKGVITDLLPMCIDGVNFLVSSSWDGTVKIWR